MNDPNKRIDVNISSLLSLKAELLRKQEEVSKAKTKQKAEPFIPKKSVRSEQSEKSDDIIEPDTIVPEEYEDSALLEKSRKVLEAKAKFYNKMTAAGGKLNSDDNCLVLFNQKKQEDRPYKESSSSSDEISGDENSNGKYSTNNPDEEWVEYTDCLGRTRQCLKKDLNFFKKKDTQLAENIQPRTEINQNAPMWMIDTKGITETIESTEIPDDTTEMTSMISKHDQMKINWEKKEEENVYKEDVHYQDVLFDEARTHGVGYYAFSTDEEERAKQRKALDEIREKTLSSQKERESQRTQREKIIAERVLAAKNRQRARLGLPPIENEPEPVKELFDTKAEEKRKKREAKEQRRKEREEKLRDDERKRHVRPWDRSKSGVRLTDDSSDDSDLEEWNYKPQKEPMSQEQWNEKQRAERKKEFAPIVEEPPPPPRTFRRQNNLENNINDELLSKDALYFTTKKPIRPNEFIKRNYMSVNQDQNPIRNELNDEENNESIRGQGTEIPPPPTFEYYGPTSTKRSKPIPKEKLEQSIEAGLRFIRDRSDKGILPTKSSWTAKADY